MAHDNIAFQERFPLSILACISLPFSFFVVTAPVMEVKKQLPYHETKEYSKCMSKAQTVSERLPR
jgi:hypothetical protein